MRKNLLNKPIFSSILIFLLCLIIRLLEYFVIKTDETFISENFIHKVIGIVILIFLLKIVNYKFKDIGFSKQHSCKYLIYGLLLGLVCFGIAYSIEYIILFLNKKNPSIEVYINGFSLVGNPVKHTEIYFFIICILLNIINVLMEEGLFRGFFTKIISKKLSIFRSNIIVAILFGLWHFVMSLKLYIWGDKFYFIYYNGTWIYDSSRNYEH